jgi:hypothetical protein
LIAAGTISPLLVISLIPEAKKFTEAIPSWVDAHVDSLLKRRGAVAQAALKHIEHIPVLGKQAQAFAWFDNKACEFTGGILKGAGSMVGGVLNMVTHPVETATGLYAMAEHVPVMNGLVPNPLKLAHAGADIIFNGADPKTRLETVIDPVKSLQDDGKFGKALVDGFIEPYKKSWSEGKYFEVAGRATFDIGSLFIGAGEANAAIKIGEVASVAGKTAEVANVAGKAEKATEAASLAGKTGKTAEVASTTDKTIKVAGAAEKTDKVAKGALSNRNIAGSRQSIAKKANNSLLSRTKIIDGLTGLTQQGNRIADGIRSGDIKMNVLGDELFDRAYASKGGWGSSPQAFALKQKIYVRRGASNLLSDIVHEGTHALDNIHGNVRVPYGNNPYPWEKRAFFYER